MFTAFMTNRLNDCALKNNFRLDGRKFNERRNLKRFCVSKETIEMSYGKSHVICLTNADVIKPYNIKSNEGVISVNIDSSIIQSKANDRTSRRIIYNNCTQISLAIEKLLLTSKALDKEILCIKLGEAVWSVKLDIKILCDDGNLLDLCSDITIKAIEEFYNSVYLIKRNKKLNISSIPITLHHKPKLLSLYKTYSNDIFDPTLAEEGVANSRISIAINEYKEICGIRKAGGQSVTVSEIMQAIKDTRNLIKEINV